MFSQYSIDAISTGNVSSSTSPSPMTSSQSCMTSSPSPSMTSSQTSAAKLGDDEGSVSPASSTLFSPSPHHMRQCEVYSPAASMTRGSEQSMNMTDSSEASAVTVQAASEGSPPEVSSTPQELMATEGKTKARPRKRRQPKAPNPPPDSGPTLPPCRVCHMKASGFHYGANTCEGCKGFFRRALQNAPSKCIADTGNCNVIGVNRKLCAFCRYQKCLSVGMGREAIKIGRYTCETRSKNIQEAKEARDSKPTKSEFPSKDPPQCISNHDTGVGSHDNGMDSHDNGIGNLGNNFSPVAGYPEAPIQPGLVNIRNNHFQQNAIFQGNTICSDYNSEKQSRIMQPNNVDLDNADTINSLLYASSHTPQEHPAIPSMINEFSNRMFDMDKILMSSLMSPNEDALMTDVDFLLDQNTVDQNAQVQQDMPHCQPEVSPSPAHLSQPRSNIQGSHKSRVRDSIDEFLFGPNSVQPTTVQSEQPNRITSQVQLKPESHASSTGVTQPPETVPFHAYPEIPQSCTVSQENLLFSNLAASEYKRADALQSPCGLLIERSLIPEGFNQMDIHSDGSTTSPSDSCSPCDKPEYHNIDFDQVNDLQQNMLARVSGDIRLKDVPDMSQESCSSPSSSSGNNFERILSLGSNISPAISEVLISSERMDISLDKRLCDFRTQWGSDLLEMLDEPEGLRTESDQQRLIEMMKLYKAVNRVQERVARPNVECANTAIDDMIHTMEINHDKHLRLTTYISDTFIQARHLKFVEMVKRREMVFGESYTMPGEDYLELYKATGHDFENRIHKLREYMVKMEAAVVRFISFVKSIPGFKSLDIEDRAFMVKKSRTCINFLGVLKGFNKSLGVFLIPDGRCVEKRLVENIWTKEITDLLFETAEKLQQEHWLPEELVLLKGILLTMIDKEKLRNPAAVDKLQNTLLTCLARALNKRFPDVETTQLVGQSLSKLKLLQPMVEACEKRLASPSFCKQLRFKFFVGKHPLLLEMFT